MHYHNYEESEDGGTLRRVGVLPNCHGRLDADCSLWASQPKPFFPRLPRRCQAPAEASG